MERPRFRMAQHMTYLVKLHNILPSFVMNTNSFNTYKRLMNWKVVWTYTCLCIWIKRQTTTHNNSVFISYQYTFTFPSCLHWKYYTIFTSHELILCESNDWYLTISANHWSTLFTCTDMMKKTFDPTETYKFHVWSCPKIKKFVRLIDCWSVHKFEGFFNWMKTNHPKVSRYACIINCINVL